MATYYLSTNLLDLNPNKVVATRVNAASNGTLYNENGESTGLTVSSQGKAVHTVAVPAGTSATSDSLQGTNGGDLIYWDYATFSGIPASLGIIGRYGLPAASQTAAIEIFDMGDGADVLSLVHSNETYLLTAPRAYSFNATAYGGNGNDVLWSGTGNDRLFGDADNDWLNGGGGNDTLYGGTGIDTLDGGSGNDQIFDANNAALVRAGDGADLIVLTFDVDSFAMLASEAGGETAADGNDRVFVNGTYASTSFALGAGNDIFMASAAGGGARSDRIAGGSGDDAISAFEGNDTLSGNAGGDVIWGGAGNDLLFGGLDSDLLYGGTGTDTLYGGGGIDLVYFGRDDGSGSQFYDGFRETGTGNGAPNGLAVFSGFSGNPADSDGFLDGAGVYDLDGSLMDNDGNDLVQVQSLGGSLYRLQIIGGGGTLGASIDFDARDVQTIGLLNNDATGGTPAIQYFTWDGSGYTQS